MTQDVLKTPGIAGSDPQDRFFGSKGSGVRISPLRPIKSSTNLN